MWTSISIGMLPILTKEQLEASRDGRIYLCMSLWHYV